MSDICCKNCYVRIQYTITIELKKAILFGAKSEKNIKNGMKMRLEEMFNQNVTL